MHKSSGTDDKKLQATLKRVGVNSIPGIEEVNIFQGDSVINFANPKVQASIAANTFVVSGPSQVKSAAEVASGPGAADIQQLMAQMAQMGGGDMAALQKMMAGVSVTRSGSSSSVLCVFFWAGQTLEALWHVSGGDVADAQKLALTLDPRLPTTTQHQNRWAPAAPSAAPRARTTTTSPTSWRTSRRPPPRRASEKRRDRQRERVSTL